MSFLSATKNNNMTVMQMADHEEVKAGRKCFYLTTHSTHFIYGYMASDIW